MTLSKTTRLQYLDAMGITIWQSRFTVEPIALPIEPIQSLEPISAENFVPDSWETLRSEVSNCQLCSLCTTRTQTVFGEGNQNADWLFIGEAPGQHEDEQGRPFIGEAGQLLTEMLKAMKLTRDEVFIANILKCRPPKNRDPHVDEIEQCRPYLQRQIALVQPRIAAQTLLETTEKIGKLRSNVYQFENVPLISIYHPSYLLRSLTEKRKAWQDLQFALQTFKQLR
jgi:DNA polymerase